MTKLDTGQVAVKALRPIHRKGLGWTIESGRVAAESPEAAASFAADLVASLKQHAAAWDARPLPEGKGPRSRPQPDYALRQTAFRPASVPLCRTGAGHRAYADVPAAQDGWRVLDAEHGDYTLRIVYLDDVTREPRKVRAPRRVEPVRIAPAPVSRKPATRRSRTAAAPAPAPAPVVASSDPLAPCERCGRTDWRTAAGRAWHVANNPDCAKYRKADRHSYAAA